MFKHELTKHHIDKIFSYLFVGILAAAVFIAPLAIINFVYSSQGVQQLALAALAALAAVVFLARAFLVRQEFSWRRSPLNVGLALLAGAVVASSLFSGRIPQVWGMSGFIPQVSPWGWLGAILLAALIVQAGREGGRSRSRFFLAAYCLSSTLLVLFVLGWYFARNQFMVLWGAPPQTMALWLAVSAAVIFALAASRGRARWFWFFGGLAHLALLFFFDYDSLWYLLSGLLALFVIVGRAFRSRFGRASFIVPQTGFLFAVLLLFVPAAWFFPGGQPQFWSGNLVPPSISAPRWRQYVFPDKKLALLGAGTGLGTLSFWQLAELVDMRQRLNFPLPANGYLMMFWEGGALLAAAFLILLLGLILSAAKCLRRRPDDNPDESLPVFSVAGVGLIGSLVAFYFLPVTFIHLFTLLLFAALAAGSAPGRVFTWTVGENEERRFAAALAIVLPVVAIAYSAFVWTRQWQAQLAFANTVTAGAEGNPTVNVDRLQRAVDLAPRAYGYRLSRNDIALQLIAQQTKPNLADIQGLFAGLRIDTAYLANQNLSGPERWQLAWQAELTGANLEAKEFADQEKGALNAQAKEWYQVASKLYDDALSAMPRNVILASEAARFYRQHAVILATPENGSQKFYDRASALVNKAISIDPNYEGSYLEKAELAALTKPPSEALSEIAGFVERSPNLAFRAGQLAYAAKSYQQAVRYYRQVLNQNAEHLSARYELVRAYAALGESEQGRQQLAELEKRVDKNNAQIAALLSELRKTVSAVPASPPSDDDKSADKKPAGR